MSKFKIGDRVVIILSAFSERIGQIASIILIGIPDHKYASKHYADYDEPIRSIIKNTRTMYMLDIKSIDDYTVNASYPEECLELYKDDGNEKGEWTDELIRICKPKLIKEKV